MAKDVTLTIDDTQVTVPAGTVIVDAAKMASSVIPVFCYHPKMAPVGMCRMCLVEVGRPEIDRATGQPVRDEEGNPKIRFGPNLETGCTVQVMDGMVVRSANSERVQSGRKEIVEFILTSHPLDCPICDKGGECPLQNLTMNHGPGKSRFIIDGKIHFAKHVPLGGLIFLDRERCIQCARCVRFQDEIVDDPVIGFYNRGRKLEIQTHSDPGFASYYSGNTTDICPVGALTTADFRFGARPWELNQAASICSQCSVGCNITFNTRREAKTGGNWVIKRVMPRQNEQVNEIWICDKGRFSTYHFAEHEDRLTQPMVRKNGALVSTTWGEALDLVAKKFKEAGSNLITLVSGRLSNEDLYNLVRLTNHLEGKALLNTYMAGGDLVAQVGVGEGSNLSDLGADDVILVVACDLQEEAPIWWLRVKQAAERGVTLIVANPRNTKLDRFANFILRYNYGEETHSIEELLEGKSDAAKAFHSAANAVVFYGSEGIGLSASHSVAQGCANLLVKTGHVGKVNNGLIGVWPRPNTQGAWDMGFRPEEDLANVINGSSTLYVVGSDPVGENPALLEVVKDSSFVVVQELFLTETAKLADVVLPVQAFVEREGSYTAGENRVQRFYMAVPPKPDTRADFTITAQIALRLDLDLEGRLPARVFQKLSTIAPRYAGLNYIALAQVEEQWPIVGRGDMYYGGTTYDNNQGMGAKLVTAISTLNEIENIEFDKFEVSEADKGLVAVPVTLLYDRGEIISKSETLTPRLANAHIVIHSNKAEEYNLVAGGKAIVKLAGLEKTFTVQIDENTPKGFLLVPRSMGLVVNGPTPVKLEAVELVAV